MKCACDECGRSGGYALYCLRCAELALKKEWVGLTQDELTMICESMKTWSSFTVTDVYFAIEAKLKEKNK
jgi:hypothetical protein